MYPLIHQHRRNKNNFKSTVGFANAITIIQSTTYIFSLLSYFPKNFSHKIYLSFYQHYSTHKPQPCRNFLKFHQESCPFRTLLWTKSNYDLDQSNYKYILLDKSNYKYSLYHDYHKMLTVFLLEYYFSDYVELS